MSNLLESLEVVKFETGVDTKSLGEKLEGVESVQNTLSETVNEVKEKIWKELSSTSLKIWDLEKKSKRMIRSLRKNSQNSTRNWVWLSLRSLKPVNRTTLIWPHTSMVSRLRFQLPEVPEVKYYDEQISESVNQFRVLESSWGSWKQTE